MIKSLYQITKTGKYRINVKERYPILYEAYEHYRKTGNRHFFITLYDDEYLSNILHISQELKDKGYIENTSDNFAITSSELLSFDITLFGINFVAHALLSQKT